MAFPIVPIRAPIERVDARACRLPTAGGPESDGTAVWDATTMVIAEVRAAGATGLGYSYVDAAAAAIVRELLAPYVLGVDAFAIPQARAAMAHGARNHGTRGLVACAISAVDIALWDLAAKLVGMPLARLLGAARDEVPVYASGGFTSSGPDALARELAGYVAAGHRRVKIKVGREPSRDVERVRVARDAIGADVELMVDANGAYTVPQAIAMAARFAEHDVVYFEEPVSSDDVAGLRRVRDRAPPGMAIAAGEYGYDATYFARIIDAVDIVQCDATRARGITGFRDADALCEARCAWLSSHCAPAVHAHAGAAARRLVHLEHFRDHARMEAIVFDGVPAVVAGAIAFDRARAGLGLSLRSSEVTRLAA